MSVSDRKRLGERPERQLHEAVVRLRCPGRTRVHTGFLKNISHAGMFLRILDPELAGVRLGFDVFLIHPDGERETLSGQGEVAWSRSEFEGPDLPPGMGIRFLGLDEGGAEILARCLCQETGAQSVFAGEASVIEVPDVGLTQYEDKQLSEWELPAEDTVTSGMPEDCDEGQEILPGQSTNVWWRWGLALLIVGLLIVGFWFRQDRVASRNSCWCFGSDERKP